jgi:hypothetical protein
MSKPGFVICKDKSTKEYFTTTSAYDRPRWVSLDESTVFPTAEIAQAAAKKLWGYGAYAATPVSLSEAAHIDFELPDEELESASPDLPPGDEFDGLSPEDVDVLDSPADDESAYGADGELEGDGIDPLDAEGELNGDDPDLDASTPADDESAYGADGELEGDGIDPMGGELDDELDPLTDENDENAISPAELDMLDRARTNESVLMELSKGTLKSYLRKAVKSTQELVTNGDMVKGVDRAKKTAWASGKLKEKTLTKESVEVKKQTYKDAAETDAVPGRDTYSDYPDCDKVPTPSSISAALRSVVRKFKQSAEAADTRDDVRASQDLTVADAIQQLLDDLSQGTVDGIKQAQIHMTSYMTPITQHIPPEVVKFIASGGKQSTLKDMFGAKWEQHRSEKQ